MPIRQIIPVLLLSLLSLPLHAEPLLRILAWPGYADPDVVRTFAEQEDVEVEVTLVGSDDELRQKLTADNGSHYDVIAANTSEIRHFTEQQLLQPVRLDNLPNRNRQLRQFRQLSDIPGLFKDGEAYGIPYTYGEMGLIYNRDLVTTPPDSLSSLWDPRWQGQVLAYDGSSHNFSLTRLKLGKPPFTIPQADLGETLQQLVALRRNVLGFYSLPEESVTLYQRHKVALILANYGRQQLKLLRDAGANVDYVLPREGALAWLDCWAVSRATPQRELAERWIDYSLTPAVSRALTERQGLGNTLEPLPGGSTAPLLIWLEPVENAEQRAQLWQRIVAGERPENLTRP